MASGSPPIQEWRNRLLQSVYRIVFLDAIHFKVKQEGDIVNKAVYMAIDVDRDGNKDIPIRGIGQSKCAK